MHEEAWKTDFWSKVKKGPKCWLWTGTARCGGNGKGYPIGYHPTQKDARGKTRQTTVQRIAWLATYHEDPPGQIKITCRNRRCCRPEHLEIGGKTATPYSRKNRTMNEQLRLDEINRDGGTQIRTRLSEQTITEYIEHISDLPPVIVFYDGESYWLADGFHRWHAFQKADRVRIPCIVRQGTRDDAVWFSIGANKEHDTAGLRRTNADKRRAVERAFELLAEQGKNKSDAEIARHVGVDHKSVASVRLQLGKFPGSKVPPAEQPRLGRDGKVRRAPKPGAAIEAKVVDLARNGTPPKEISKQLGISQMQVQHAKRKHGLNAKERNPLKGIFFHFQAFSDLLQIQINRAIEDRTWEGATPEQVDETIKLITKVRSLVFAAAKEVEKQNQKSNGHVRSL